jgi:hypothetical protein
MLLPLKRLSPEISCIVVTSDAALTTRHSFRNAAAGRHPTQVRVYDLKHRFGRRLRAAGVSFEDRPFPMLDVAIGHAARKKRPRRSGASVRGSSLFHGIG